MAWKEGVMPREYVYTDAANPDGTAPQRAVSVGWHESGYVQLATVVNDETMSEGQFADLDRRQINDLIRLLRKARDRAFGRDE
jgi:hypothetical protein